MQIVIWFDGRGPEMITNVEETELEGDYMTLTHYREDDERRIQTVVNMKKVTHVDNIYEEKK